MILFISALQPVGISEAHFWGHGGSSCPCKGRDMSPASAEGIEGNLA